MSKYNLKKDVIKTPFGTIKSEVSLFPLGYILTVYLSGLLKWNIWEDKTIYQLWSNFEHLSEHFQFIFYLSASFFSIVIILKNQYKVLSLQNINWIIFFIFCFFISIEEVSYLNNIQGNFFDSIRSNNMQNEVNFHNSLFFNSFLHSGMIIINIFLGWFGWRYLCFIDAIPKKIYSLYFLFTALAFTIIRLKILFKSSFLLAIPLSDETFEFLMALGLFLHSLAMLRKYLRN